MRVDVGNITDPPLVRLLHLKLTLQHIGSCGIYSTAVIARGCVAAQAEINAIQLITKRSLFVVPTAFLGFIVCLLFNGILPLNCSLLYFGEVRALAIWQFNRGYEVSSTCPTGARFLTSLQSGLFQVTPVGSIVCHDQTRSNKRGRGNVLH